MQSILRRRQESIGKSRLKVSEDRIALVTLGPERKEVRGEWRKLHEFNLRYPKSSIEGGGLPPVGCPDSVGYTWA